MSNPDKHKPLSAEELFKLLDNTSNKANDFDELDDFEKEALEGFSVHSNSQKAKDLTEELNLAISKKVTDSDKGGTKNKIIWFSAAASIVLVIMLSVFFFNQTKEDSATNLALNEIKEDKKPTSVLAEPSMPLETVTGSTTNIPEKTKNITLGQTKFQEKVMNKNAEGESAAGLVSESLIEALEKNKNELALDIATKDESKVRKENDDKDQDRQKVAEGLTDKMDAKKKEKNNLAQEQTNSELQAKQNVATTTSSTNNTKSTKEEDGYYKADENRAPAVTQSLEKEKTASAPAMGAVSKSNNNKISKESESALEGTISKKNIADATLAGIHGDMAYYKGGVTEIQKDVLFYLKSTNNATKLVGKFKVNGMVDENGTFKLAVISQTSGEICNCIDVLTKALNSIKKWTPYLDGEFPKESIVGFTLSF